MEDDKKEKIDLEELLSGIAEGENIVVISQKNLTDLFNQCIVRARECHESGDNEGYHFAAGAAAAFDYLSKSAEPITEEEDEKEKSD